MLDVRREQLQVFMEILDKCSRCDLGLSRVMYECNVNCSLLKNTYLPALTDLGYLEVLPTKNFERNGRVLYRTTSLGLVLLREYFGVQKAVLRFDVYAQQGKLKSLLPTV